MDEYTRKMVERFLRGDELGLEVEHTEQHCLKCKCKLNVSTNMGSVASKGEGSRFFTVCLYCGHWMAFEKDMTLKPLTPEEQIELRINPDLKKLADAANTIIKISTSENN